MFMKDIIYYFDGYHGGQEGHMPLGAFRTILDLLDENPKWKVNLDIEPESYKLLRYRDSETFYRLVDKLKEKEPRIEIVDETYSQPMSCALNGESIIRNFVYGRETLKESFADIDVENFFSQEPIFSSCMPQILLSLGYKHASLFNSTIFAGYTHGVNAAVVKWKGNDGSVIPAIPTYGVNEIVKHENNGSVWWSFYNFFAPPDFVKACYDAGIIPPSAMGLQDLGYNAEFAPEAKHDGIDRGYLEYATPKEYFKSVNADGSPVLSGQELVRVSLPWSEKNLSEYLKAIKKYEYDLLTAETLNFFAALYLGRNEESLIRDCWKRFMLLSHHDVFVCTNHDFTKSMRYQIFALDNNFRDLKNDLKFALINDKNDELTITVFNPLSKNVRRLVKLDLALNKTVCDVKVFTNGKEINADCSEHEINSGFSEPLDAETYMKNDCHKIISFYDDFKPFEFKEFTVVPTTERTEKCDIPSLVKRSGDKVVFENAVVKIVIDLACGGAVTSYYDKIKAFEYVKGGGTFNELRGYFDSEKRFVSSLENRADIISLNCGENVAVLRLSVSVATATVFTEYTVYKESAYLDVKTTVSCDNGTKIGDSYKADGWFDLHRTFYDIKYGFNAYFATSFEQKHLDKHCAFDICRTKDENTSYNNVKNIKHNIAVDFLDVTDGKRGLAVLLGRTTAYVKENEGETGVSLLWGTDCSCIWNSDLSGVKRTETYRIFPHEGTWEYADLWGINDEMRRKPFAFVGRAKTNFAPPFVLKTDNVETSALFTENSKYYIRLFNYGDERKIEIELGKDFVGIAVCSHDKTEMGEVIEKNAASIASVSMRRFEIKTFRLIKT